MNDEKVCIICGSTRNIQQHHVFGGIGRRMVSDREGCVVYLCAEHHTGRSGVHSDPAVDRWLKQSVQRKWEAERGGGDPRADFIRTFASLICEVPVRLPGLNEYTRACRANAYQGARMKKDAEDAIMPFIRRLPVLKPPVVIAFHWAIAKDKRDFDNIAFAKKYILDALVKAGKLPDDDRRHVNGFHDMFFNSAVYKVGVILEIWEGKQ